MKSIFLSYADADESFASRLAGDLEEVGFLIYKDIVSVLPDMSLLDRLLAESRTLNFILLVISKSSEKKTTAAYDWRDAIFDEVIHSRNWLVPILLEDCVLPEYVFVNNIEDFRDISAYYSSFQRLLTVLKQNSSPNKT